MLLAQISAGGSGASRSLNLKWQTGSIYIHCQIADLKSMTNEIIKKEETKPAKHYSAQEIKDIFIKNIKLDSDPVGLLHRFSKETLPKLEAGEKTSKEDDEKVFQLSRTFSVETGHALVEGVSEKYMPLALQLKRDLEKEFDCKTISERAVADMAAMSYARKMAFSNKLASNQTYLGSDQEGYRNFLSREIDRSHRQFLSSLEILRCQKQPTLKVNVKTNNAFIGENQQFNNNQNNESK